MRQLRRVWASAVAAAMIDRIVHHADALILKGVSCLLRRMGIDTLPSARAEQAHSPRITLSMASFSAVASASLCTVADTCLPVPNASPPSYVRRLLEMVFLGGARWSFSAEQDIRSGDPLQLPAAARPARSG